MLLIKGAKLARRFQKARFLGSKELSDLVLTFGGWFFSYGHNL